MSDWKARRFWKEATVVALDDGFTVELDGRRVKTPAKRPLTLPTRAMASPWLKVALGRASWR